MYLRMSWCVSIGERLLCHCLGYGARIPNDPANAQIVRFSGTFGLLRGDAMRTSDRLAQRWENGHNVRCKVIAHRGASLHRPANTLDAFRLALDMGADVLETDVHWTRDGVLVVSHDEVVDTVSNGQGRIADMTYAELLRLDFGYRFSPDGGKTFPFRGQGVRIPTFLELLKGFPNCTINVDIKPRDARISEFLRVVDAVGALERIILASFHHATLLEARSRCPRLRTSASVREVASFLLASRMGIRRTKHRLPYVALQVPRERYGITVVDQTFVDRAHAAGVEVHVWTIDDPDEMRRLIDLGVDGIVTNSPQTLQSVLLESGA
ncbi:glycerophosphoryl diester phosphodiesterase [Alicyclobacillus hesperidum]|uniref:Glycerophosphoryl diester phosphodiesterase n=2 Tax=Alicyclobacillus hesperidum TaxID=89784 RepID=A0A1H2RJZ5_9BACL|nr:glycerophosphoryl diester phosphodiesterase [Alicyclobacillus hesperidum]